MIKPIHNTFWWWNKLNILYEYDITNFTTVFRILDGQKQHFHHHHNHNQHNHQGHIIHTSDE